MSKKEKCKSKKSKCSYPDCKEDYGLGLTNSSVTLFPLTAGFTIDLSGISINIAQTFGLLAGGAFGNIIPLNQIRAHRNVELFNGGLRVLCKGDYEVLDTIGPLNANVFIPSPAGATSPTAGTLGVNVYTAVLAISCNNFTLLPGTVKNQTISPFDITVPTTGGTTVAVNITEVVGNAFETFRSDTRLYLLFAIAPVLTPATLTFTNITLQAIDNGNVATLGVKRLSCPSNKYVL